MAASSKPEPRIFKTEEDLAVSLAEYIAKLSEKCVKETGVFAVVLSGGGLIDNIRKLTKSPYLESVDWAKWHIFWVDERVVSKDDVNSNYKPAKDDFLSKVPINLDSQVHAINGALSAEGAADDYEARLKLLVSTKVLHLLPPTGFPRFDLILLGMGLDGHVASLFPGHPQLQEKKRWVTYVFDSPTPPDLPRVTLTFPVINSASNIAMVVTGDAEAVPVVKALGKKSDPPLPVQMLEPEVTTWFLDKDAASKL